MTPHITHHSYWILAGLVALLVIAAIVSILIAIAPRKRG